MTAISAEMLGVPAIFNAATHFVDRNVAEGRGSRVAIECGDARITYAEVQHHVNRVGNALRGIGVRPEDRVLLLLLDGPEFVYSFFGAIKIGAVPVPLNTLWKPADYQYVIRDSRAGVVIVSTELRLAIDRIPDDDRRPLQHVIEVGPGSDSPQSFARFESQGSIELDAESTSRDAPAFWLYSSGSTGAPKGCVHLQHDMVVCAELFGNGVLGIRQSDRCFSVAKLFFAYGLGNAMYFPFAVGATTILWPGAVTPPIVYDVIERSRPTLFFSVPTHYAMLLAHHDPAREFDLSSIRCAVSAGEALPPAVFNRSASRCSSTCTARSSRLAARSRALSLPFIAVLPKNRGRKTIDLRRLASEACPFLDPRPLACDPASQSLTPTTRDPDACAFEDHGRRHPSACDGRCRAGQ